MNVTGKNVTGLRKTLEKIDWLFWISIVMMAVGYAIPGVGVIGAQILMLNNGK